MSEEESQREGPDWRARFISQSSDYDALKGRYREHTELLQRLLSRLCLTVDDSNTEFQDEIQLLRSRLRSESTSLSDLSRSLSSIDQLLLNQQEDAESGASSDRSKRAQKSRFGTYFSRLLGRWRKPDNRSGGQSASPTDHHALPDSDAESVAENVVLSAQMPDQVRGPDKDIQQAREIELAPIDSEQGHADPEEVPGYGAIARKISDILTNLLSQLSYPESAMEDLEALQARIASRVNWYELPPTLEDLSNLILSSLGKSQRQFDAFLRQLDEELQATLSFISTQGEKVRDAQRLGQQLSESITNSQNLLEEMEAGSNVDENQLKASIRAHLDQIAQTVRELASPEQVDTQANGSDELDRLKSQLGELMNEQRELRQRLKEERELALTDKLTGLPNREAYDERLEFEYLRWLRYRNSAVVIATDIDQFKLICEQYGPLSGDRTLQIVAKEIKQRVRNTDFFARYGADEFVLVMPLTEHEVAMEVIDKLRQTVTQLPFHFKAQRVQLTMSFGVVPFHECPHFSDLAQKARYTLNMSRVEGGNRVKTWSKEQEE